MESFLVADHYTHREIHEGHPSVLRAPKPSNSEMIENVMCTPRRQLSFYILVLLLATIILGGAIFMINTQFATISLMIVLIGVYMIGFLHISKLLAKQIQDSDQTDSSEIIVSNYNFGDGHNCRNVNSVDSRPTVNVSNPHQESKDLPPPYAPPPVYDELTFPPENSPQFIAHI